MTQKDYIKIAIVLREAMRVGNQCNSCLVDKFAVMLKTDNPTFDRAKFIKMVYQF